MTIGSSFVSGMEANLTKKVQAGHNLNDIHKYYDIGSDKEQELLKDLEERLNSIDYKYVDFLGKSGAVVKDKKESLENLTEANKMLYMLMIGACAYPVLSDGVSLKSVGLSYLMFKGMRKLNPELDAFYTSSKDAVVETFLHNMTLKEGEKYREKGLDPKDGRWYKLRDKAVAKHRSVGKYEIVGKSFGKKAGVPRFTARSAALTQIGITKHAYDQLITPGLDRIELKDLINNAAEVGFVDDVKLYNDPVDRFKEHLGNAGMRREDIDKFVFEMCDKCRVAENNSKKNLTLTRSAGDEKFRFLSQGEVDEIYGKLMDDYPDLKFKNNESIIEEYNKGISALNDLARLDGVKPEDIDKNVRVAVSTLVRNHPEMGAYFKEYNEGIFEKKYVTKAVLNNRGEKVEKRVFEGDFVDKDGNLAFNTFTLRQPEDMFAHGDKLRNTMVYNIGRSFDKFDRGEISDIDTVAEVEEKLAFYFGGYMYYHTEYYEDSPFKEMGLVDEYREKMNDPDFTQMDKNIRSCISDIGFAKFTLDYTRALGKSFQYINNEFPEIGMVMGNRFRDLSYDLKEATGLDIKDILVESMDGTVFGKKDDRYNYKEAYNEAQGKKRAKAKYEEILEEMDNILDRENIDLDGSYGSVDI